ncbi:MAG: response regulator, partial [Trichodesmium sp. St19_bin2]|nr:response regulator [Trichodesmium sp. St19_bin2]
IPVVMCSSKGEEFDRYWGLKQGADAYIAKPFQPTELVGTVKQLLRR